MGSETGYVLFFSWGAIVALFCFVVSIMPIGYSDGNMLVHLILKTRAGDLLLDHLRLAQNQEQPSTVTDQDLREATAGISDG